MIKINDVANMRKILALPVEQYEAAPLIIPDTIQYTLDVLRMLSNVRGAYAATTSSSDMNATISVPVNETWEIIALNLYSTLAIPTRIDVFARNEDGTAWVCLGNIAVGTAINVPVPLSLGGPLIIDQGWNLRATTVGVIASTTITFRVFYRPLRSA